MIFNFLNIRKRAINSDSVDFSRDEVLHPAIADLMIAQEKTVNQSSHDRDYGAKRLPVNMPVAFV